MKTQKLLLTIGTVAALTFIAGCDNNTTPPNTPPPAPKPASSEIGRAHV